MRLDRRALLVALAVVAASPVGLQQAKADKKHRGSRGERDEDDHHNATKARDAGEILPVSEIMADVKANYPGEIVGFELERNHNRWVYEFKIITPANRYIEVYVDAKDKSVVKVEGK